MTEPAFFVLSQPQVLHPTTYADFEIQQTRTVLFAANAVFSLSVLELLSCFLRTSLIKIKKELNLQALIVIRNPNFERKSISRLGVCSPKNCQCVL
ncbi:hypothetical protein BpHYR1_052101 [Brachionus plicatilis]|uniref:Uncharacterized protein n=1 Tax=Brachionus plicatilis TaxID=10195 RepID=A0A3M7RPZ2_BRAPC|nr:hypothetical protein BpHYR1_052101 [Brachionus plicatilis]